MKRWIVLPFMLLMTWRQRRREGNAAFTPLVAVSVKPLVQYKMVPLTHGVFVTSTPSYFNDLLPTHTPTLTLRSSSTPVLIGPRNRTQHCLPQLFPCRGSICNSVSPDVRLRQRVNFMRHVKTRLHTAVNVVRAPPPGLFCDVNIDINILFLIEFIS